MQEPSAPVLALACFSDVNRASVGLAGLTMNRGLGLTATEFGGGAGILFAGCRLLDVPSRLTVCGTSGPDGMAMDTAGPPLLAGP